MKALILFSVAIWWLLSAASLGLAIVEMASK